MEIERIERKTLLYKSKVEYANWAINHIVGCAHGCRYPCYAMHQNIKYKIVKNYDDWRRPKVVSNALEILDKEIPKLKGQIKNVHMCFMTDPFMYDGTETDEGIIPNIWEIADLSMKIIKKLNENNIPVTVLTKGLYPHGSIAEAMHDKALHPDNKYGITVVSLSEEFKEQYEPYAAPIETRIERLKDIHSIGCKTWVSMEPYPTPSISADAHKVEEILDQIGFVDSIVFGRWNYNSLAFKDKGGYEFYGGMFNKIFKFCNGKNSHNKKIQLYAKHGTLPAGLKQIGG